MQTINTLKNKVKLEKVKNIKLCTTHCVTTKISSILRPTLGVFCPVASLRQVLAGPMPCHRKNGTWRWDLPVIL